MVETVRCCEAIPTLRRDRWRFTAHVALLAQYLVHEFKTYLDNMPDDSNQVVIHTKRRPPVQRAIQQRSSRFEFGFRNTVAQTRWKLDADTQYPLIIWKDKRDPWGESCGQGKISWKFLQCIFMPSKLCFEESTPVKSCDIYVLLSQVANRQLYCVRKFITKYFATTSRTPFPDHFYNIFWVMSTRYIFQDSVKRRSTAVLHVK